MSTATVEAPATIARLSDRHLAELRSSGLSDETIAAAGIRAITAAWDIGPILGWDDLKLLPCMLFPYFQHDGEQIPPTEFARIKPDKLYTYRNGDTAKYLSPKGSGCRVYFPPNTRQFLSDPTVSLLITEGEKKSLKADQEGFACVGLGGVDSWSKSRETGPDGKKIGDRELIKDFDHVALFGRKVFIAFDSDIVEKTGVQRAEWELSRALAKRGAVVKCVRLPDGPLAGDGKPSKVGLDDYLLTHSANDLQALIDAAIDPVEPVKPVKKEKPGRRILTPGTWVKCGDRGNFGTVNSDDGGPTLNIHFVSEDGNTDDVNIPANEIQTLDGVGLFPVAFNLEIRTAGELVNQFSQLRRPIIDGLLRAGETMNVISAPKFGKSWLVLGMALSVACGRRWLDKFFTTSGKVLLCDNELHAETLAHRLPRVAMAMGLTPDDYATNLSVVNLRGSLVDLPALAEQLSQLDRGAFDLIVLDAWYRLQPAGSDENSNGDVTALYNLLDSVAHKIGCAFVAVHHSSKGNQSGKSVTDVGSGAGAQARAPDTHLILRQHEADDAVAVEAAVRSWAPLAPFCMRWEFPVWLVDDHLNPADIRKERPRKAAANKPNTEAGEPTPRDKVLEVYRQYPEGETARILRAKCRMSCQRFNQVNDQLLADGLVEEFTAKKAKNAVVMYRLTEVGQVGQVGQNQLTSHQSQVGGTDCPPVRGQSQSHLAGTSRDTEQDIWSDLPDMDIN